MVFSITESFQFSVFKVLIPVLPCFQWPVSSFNSFGVCSFQWACLQIQICQFLRLPPSSMIGTLVSSLPVSSFQFPRRKSTSFQAPVQLQASQFTSSFHLPAAVFSSFHLQQTRHKFPVSSWQFPLVTSFQFRRKFLVSHFSFTGKFPVSSFQFPVSSFQFPDFQFPVRSHSFQFQFLSFQFLSFPVSQFMKFPVSSFTVSSFQLSVSSFQFPVSNFSFQFPVSSFQFPSFQFPISKRFTVSKKFPVFSQNSFQFPDPASFQ